MSLEHFLEDGESSKGEGKIAVILFSFKAVFALLTEHWFLVNIHGIMSTLKEIKSHILTLASDFP